MTQKNGGMLTRLKAFRADERGNVGFIFAIMLVPFLICVGLAVDYGRAVVAKHELQVALDTAVLAAGSLKLASEDERKQLGKAFFEANFNASGRTIDVPDDLVSIQNGTVTATQSLEISTRFLQFLGFADRHGSPSERIIGVKTSSTAFVPQVGKAEIALVLDYSGSMDDELGGATKYVTMRNAAKDLISFLHSGANNGAGIAFSLVPFSYGVKAKLMGKHLTDAAGTKLSGETRVESCLSGRKENVTNDTEPVDDKRHRWQQDDLWYDKGSYNSDRTSKCSTMLLMRELTSSTGLLQADLNSWEPYGGTHISSGFQFGWHAISPNSVFSGGVSYDMISHEDPEQRVLKAIVLLTDGAQTVPAYRKNGAGQDNTEISDPSWPLDKSNGEHNLEQQCLNAKSEGILVVTVAFDLDDDDTVDRLHDCASLKDAADPNKGRYAFTANSTGQLRTAFSEIGDILADMVYLSN